MASYINTEKASNTSSVSSLPIMTLIIDNVRHVENEGHFSKAEDRKFDYVPIIDAGAVMKGSKLKFQMEGFRQPDEIIVQIQSGGLPINLDKIDDSMFKIGNDLKINNPSSLHIFAKWLDEKQVLTYYGLYFYSITIMDKASGS